MLRETVLAPSQPPLMVVRSAAEARGPPAGVVMVGAGGTVLSRTQLRAVGVAEVLPARSVWLMVKL